VIAVVTVPLPRFERLRRPEIPIFDTNTGCRIRGIYNRYLGRFYVFLQDPATGRFYSAVNMLCLCVVCSFDSRTYKQVDPHKTLIVETTKRVCLTDVDWYRLTSEASFRELLARKAEELLEECYGDMEYFEVPGAPYPVITEFVAGVEARVPYHDIPRYCPPGCRRVIPPQVVTLRYELCVERYLRRGEPREYAERRCGSEIRSWLKRICDLETVPPECISPTVMEMARTPEACLEECSRLAYALESPLFMPWFRYGECRCRIPSGFCREYLCYARVDREDRVFKGKCWSPTLEEFVSVTPRELAERDIRGRPKVEAMPDRVLVVVE
jgi:hypothetical protein